MKSYLISALAKHALLQSTYNGKPDYSADGESYSWAAWVTATTNTVEQLGRLIQLEAGPFEVVSVAR
jgi:hypothetical protein